MRKLSIILGCFLLVTIFTANVGAMGSGANTLYIMILDRCTLKPVQATVSVLGNDTHHTHWEVQTDGAGRAVFEVPSAGFLILITAYGYVPEAHAIKITENQIIFYYIMPLPKVNLCETNSTWACPP